jgi:hypothetical protein
VTHLLLWPTLGVLFATHFKISTDRPWHIALQVGTIIWLPWLFLAPLIVTAVRRWCQRPHHLAVDALAWGAGMVICVGVYALVAQGGMNLIREQAHDLPGPPPGGFSRKPPPQPPKYLPQVFGAIPVYLSITAFAAISVSRQRMVQRERQVLRATAELHRSKLEMLYAQLRPHFLFNALNTIASLVHREPDVVDHIVTSLGALLHETLESDVNREVTLSHELDLVEMYLDIERARFGDALRLKIEVPDGCKGLHVPVLILQPVVENAVRHGLGPRKGAGTVTIRAHFETRGRMLRIFVQDDGVGIKAPLRDGIGLENTRARLRAAYGALDDAGGDETYKGNVSVAPLKEGGTLAIIDIPQGKAV